MTPHNAAIFACRILAILALLLSIQSVLNFIAMLPLLVEMVGPGFSWEALRPYLAGSLGDSLSGVVLLNFALLLWFFAPIVAKWITRGMQEETSKDPQPSIGWYTMAVALLGFLLLGTVDFAIYSHVITSLMGGLENWYSPILIIAVFFHFFLGLLLVYRCRSVAEWILREDCSQTTAEGREY